MTSVPPPHDAYVTGWDLYEYAIGYYASVTLTSAETMKLTFAPNETGLDSGLFAKDGQVSSLTYNLYVPRSDAAIRIPGGIDLPTWARTPGWNAVTVTPTQVSINGRVVEDALGNPVQVDPTDLSCFVTKVGVPYVLLDGFKRTSLEDQTFQTRITVGKNNDPELNGQLLIEAADAQTLVFKYRGQDGVVRTASLALQ